MKYKVYAKITGNDWQLISTHRTMSGALNRATWLCNTGPYHFAQVKEVGS